jgi:hypothetical protein
LLLLGQSTRRVSVGPMVVEVDVEVVEVAKKYVSVAKKDEPPPAEVEVPEETDEGDAGDVLGGALDV